VARLRYPAWLEQVVITVRLLTYWNSKRISAELRRREIASVSETWVEALFDRRLAQLILGIDRFRFALKVVHFLATSHIRGHPLSVLLPVTVRCPADRGH